MCGCSGFDGSKTNERENGVADENGVTDENAYAVGSDFLKKSMVGLVIVVGAFFLYKKFIK